MKQKEAWQLLADQLDGEYTLRGKLLGPKVIFDYRNFNLCLDTYTIYTGKTNVTYTRLQVVFVDKCDFRMHVSKNNFFFKIAKFFGMDVIQVNDEDLDTKLVFKCSDSYLIKDILTRDSIKSSLLAAKQINIRIPKKKQENSNRLYQEATLTRIRPKVIKDIDELKDWIQLFKDMIDAFVELDITEDVKPDYIA